MDENRLALLLEEIRDLQRQQVEAYGRAMPEAPRRRGSEARPHT
jgi:hypothetical protein